VQLGGGAGERDAAVTEDVEAVGEFEDLADFLPRRSDRRQEAPFLFTIDRQR
jgi:hypothetical protein